MSRSFLPKAQTWFVVLLAVFLAAGCRSDIRTLILTVEAMGSEVDARWHWAGAAPAGALEYRLLQRSQDVDAFFVAAVTQARGVRLAVAGAGVETFRVEAWRGQDLVGQSGDVTALVEAPAVDAAPMPQLSTVAVTGALVLSGVLWGPESRNCAGRDVNGVIQIFRCKSFAPVSEVIEGALGEMLVWSPGDAGLAVGRFGAIEVRDTSWNLIGAHSEVGWGLVRSATFDTTSTVFVAAGQIVDHVDLDSGLAERILANTVNVEAIEACSTVIALGDEDGRLIVIHADGDVPSQTIPIAGSSVRGVHWHENCESLHVVAEDGSSTVLSKQESGWKVEGTLARGTMSPDGRFVASIESGGVVSVFPVEAPTLVTTVAASISEARGVSWSSDARHLMVIGAGLELLEVNTGGQE